MKNSGGLVARKTIKEMYLEHWNKVMDLNLTGVFMMTKAALAHMKKGAIINVASQAARDGGGACAAAYAACKGAEITLSENGTEVATGQMESSVAGRFGIDTFGFGEDSGQPVTAAYKPPFVFTGGIESVVVEVV